MGNSILSNEVAIQKYDDLKISLKGFWLKLEVDCGKQTGLWKIRRYTREREEIYLIIPFLNI